MVIKRTLLFFYEFLSAYKWLISSLRYRCHMVRSGRKVKLLSLPSSRFTQKLILRLVTEYVFVNNSCYGYTEWQTQPKLKSIVARSPGCGSGLTHLGSISSCSLYSTCSPRFCNLSPSRSFSHARLCIREDFRLPLNVSEALLGVFRIREI